MAWNMILVYSISVASFAPFRNIRHAKLDFHRVYTISTYDMRYDV